MRSRWRGLLPSLVLIAILPLTLLLIGVAVGATTLHQTEMRQMVATHNEQIVREAAFSLADRLQQRLLALQLIAEAATLADPARVLQRLDPAQADFEEGVTLEPGTTLTTSFNLSTTAQGGLIAQARSADGTLTARGRLPAQVLDLPVFADALQSSSRLHVVLLDANAAPLYHAESSALRFDALGIFAPGISAALQGRSGTVFVTDPAGVEWVVAYAAVPHTGWGLISAEPWEDVVNPLLRTSLLTPLMLIPAFVIAVVAIFFGARRVIRPLQQLDVQAARAGQGDYAALAQPIDGINELQDLHATLARMADQIQRDQRSLQSYAADVIRGQEDERSRLAHELHDETVQALIVLDQRLQQIERTAQRDPSAAGVKISELRSLTATTIDDVRRVIRDLRPIYLEDLGLVPALEMLVQSLRRDDGPRLTLTVEGEPCRLLPERELAIYRLVQEALNNVIKHARAKQAAVKLTFTSELSVVVHDDGAGFAPPDQLDALTNLGHFGLIGMRERAELIGARLKIASSPGQGTTVELHLPL